MEVINPAFSNLEEYFVPFDTDTIRMLRVAFTALEEDAKYTWKIGSETLHTQTVVRSHFPVHEVVPITLIVEKEPNSLCFPDDDGIDTLTRFLYTVKPSYDSIFFDDFHGYLEGNPQDTFTVSIREKILLGDSFFYIKNLERDCESSLRFTGFAYRQMLFDGESVSCNRPKGQARISTDNVNEITITYTFGYGEDKDKSFVFKGVRK
ncbi:MAG TPA: hypothetical protein ENK85_11290 [Saprospiraceae bacterium]|nr:hypothetical protein [Saprospiraceae bacterium]